MADGVTVRVLGLEAFAAACMDFSEGAWATLKEHLLRAGYRVQADVEEFYLTVNKSGPDNRGAGGIRAEASGTGAYVVQSIRKSEKVSLRRPNYGPRMMRKAFLPAAWENRSFTLMQAAMAMEEAKRLFWDAAPRVIIVG